MHESSTQIIPDVSDVPRHVAIIMDGNGRWARQRGLPRLEGHRRGVEAVRTAMARLAAQVAEDEGCLAGGRVPAPIDVAAWIAASGVSIVEPGQADLLKEHFPFTATWLHERRPCYAVVVGDQAVSICYSARRTGTVAEAGVDTAEVFRGRGYAALYRNTVLQAPEGCDFDFLTAAGPVPDNGDRRRPRPAMNLFLVEGAADLKAGEVERAPVDTLKTQHHVVCAHQIRRAVVHHPLVVLRVVLGLIVADEDVPVGVAEIRSKPEPVVRVTPHAVGHHPRRRDVRTAASVDAHPELTRCARSILTHP